jgi:hypothetical protein
MKPKSNGILTGVQRPVTANTIGVCGSNAMFEYVVEGTAMALFGAILLFAIFCLIFDVGDR